MKRSIHPILSILALAGLFVGLAFSPPIQETANVQITQVDTTQFPRVTFFVSITDANGQPLPVDANRLIITENGQQIPLDQIEGIGDVGPITTLLVIDVSDSMNSGDKLDAAKAAAHEFIGRMRPEDQAGIVTFNTRIQTVQDLTSDQSALNSAVDGLIASNNTAMYDALMVAIDQLEGVEGRKAIIVLTDGLDNSSASSSDDVVNRIGSSGFSISTVGLGEPGLTTEDAGLDEPALQDLADRAGGVYGYAADQDALVNLYETYAVSLQSEYQITYTSPAALRDGVNRSLGVSLAPVGGGSPVVNEDSRYNPGGLVPEVAQPASWPFFGIVVLGLAALVVIPMLLTNWRSTGTSTQISGSNGHASRSSKSGSMIKTRPRPKIKLK
jgi:VWFA-related protein